MVRSQAQSYKIYDWETVRKHSTLDDAWVVIHGYVHDVTAFARDHPGGVDILLEHLGTDATEVFSSDDVHSHSPAAFKILEDYRIGIMESKKADFFNQKKYNIDVNKPMLAQVGSLGSDYFEWVHTPIHPKSGGIRLFKSDFLEFFTRTPWWMIPLLWVPAASYVIYNAYSLSESGTYTTAIFIFNILLWYLLEYVIHRWLFHMYAGSYKMNVFHFLLHGIHHLTPMDKDRLVFPPAPGVAIAALAYKLLSPIFFPANAFAITGGLILGYVSYDLTHYYIHHQVPRFQHFRTMKTYHMNHHYKDPDVGYGITSKVLDYVFGTLPPVGR